MKDQELNNRVSQTLQEFESMENIPLSTEWSDTLLKKLAAAKPNRITGFSSRNVSIVIVLLLLVNVSFIIKTIMNDSQKVSNRNIELEAVSNELLFNQTSINN